MAAVPEKRRAAIFSYRYKMLLLLVFQHLHYFFHFFALIFFVVHKRTEKEEKGGIGKNFRRTGGGSVIFLGCYAGKELRMLFGNCRKLLVKTAKLHHL